MSFGYALLTYLSAAVVVFLPVYCVWRLWTRDYARARLWLADLLTALALIALVFVVGRWDIVGFSLRLWFCIFFAVAATCSAMRLSSLTRDKKETVRLLTAVEPLVVLAVMVWALSGHIVASPALDIASPLRGGTHYVVHGGGSLLLNYHGALAPSQRYALDITRLGPWSTRASGLYPSELSDYAAFGDTIFAPLAGEVVSAEDSLPDQQPSSTRTDRPYGNHVWIMRGDTALVIAHLKQGSVHVQPAERVEIGDPVGQVGNTGATAEPHLHLHAVVTDGSAEPTDSLLHAGQALPLRIDGRFLARNELLP